MKRKIRNIIRVKDFQNGAKLRALVINEKNNSLDNIIILGIIILGLLGLNILVG